jgi:hypothetical protein
MGRRKKESEAEKPNEEYIRMLEYRLGVMQRDQERELERDLGLRK